MNASMLKNIGEFFANARDVIDELVLLLLAVATLIWIIKKFFTSDGDESKNKEKDD